VNGVLRSFLRQADRRRSGSLANDNDHPAWLANRWRRYFGTEEANALLLASNQPAPLVLRVNSLKNSRDELLEKLAAAKVHTTPTRYSPLGVQIGHGMAVDKLPGFGEGCFQVQGESSQLVGLLLAPQPGERILDACAAPGGKATFFAEQMEDRGTIIAIDSSEAGIRRVNENLQRLGLQSIRAMCADICGSLPPDLTTPYDRVLVDAPCSGLGTLRSHPEIKWQRSDADITRLAALQAKILTHIAPRVKPGGVLVYSTCTLAEEENETVIDTFLRQHREFVLQDAARYLPEPARHMVRGKFFQALPQRDNMDGFFAARMRKAS
jgi:16S rRNA (cytosine967-C5)-methyltransferase